MRTRWFMQAFMLVGFLMLVCGSCQTRTAASSKVDANFTGLWISRANDGRVVEEVTYVAGVRDGPWRFFGDDGSVVLSGTYRKGERWDGVYPIVRGETTMWARFLRGIPVETSDRVIDLLPDRAGSPGSGG